MAASGAQLPAVEASHVGGAPVSRPPHIRTRGRLPPAPLSLPQRQVHMHVWYASHTHRTPSSQYSPTWEHTKTKQSHVSPGVALVCRQPQPSRPRLSRLWPMRQLLGIQLTCQVGLWKRCMTRNPHSERGALDHVLGAAHEPQSGKEESSSGRPGGSRMETCCLGLPESRAIRHMQERQAGPDLPHPSTRVRAPTDSGRLRNEQYVEILT